MSNNVLWIIYNLSAYKKNSRKNPEFKEDAYLLKYKIFV